MAQLLERTRDDKFRIRDVSSKIGIADNKKTGFTSIVSKGTEPIQTMTEWPLDSYPAPTTVGAIDEADVSVYEDLSEPNAILQARVQIFERKPRVSRLANLAMEQTGVPNKKAFARSVAKAIVMVKRDMETTFLSDNESFRGTGAAGYQTRGIGKWAQNAAQTDLPVDAQYRTPATSILTGAAAAITDDAITGIMQSMYDQTGDSDMDITGWCGSRLKKQLSSLTKYDTVPAGLTLARRYGSNVEELKITTKVDVLDTDFGRVTLRLSSFINKAGDPTTDASKGLGYLMPMTKDAVRVRFAKNPTFHEHPNLGGGPRGHVEAVAVLEVGNPLWLGKIEMA